MVGGKVKGLNWRRFSSEFGSTRDQRRVTIPKESEHTLRDERAQERSWNLPKVKQRKCPSV